MANSTKSVFLSSAKAVTENQSTVNDCCAKQCLPAVVTGQLGHRVIAIPAEHLRATIFAVAAKEGHYALKVSLGGTVKDGALVAGEEYNLKLGGWVKAYPHGADAPADALVLSAQETQAVEAFKPKQSKLWFEIESEFVFVVPAISTEKHYVKDANGNRVSAGTDANGNQVWELAEHQVISFPLGVIKGSIQGSGTGGTITKDEMSEAAARAKALMGSVSARSL